VDCNMEIVYAEEFYRLCEFYEWPSKEMWGFHPQTPVASIATGGTMQRL